MRGLGPIYQMVFLLIGLLFPLKVYSDVLVDPDEDEEV